MRITRDDAPVMPSEWGVDEDPPMPDDSYRQNVENDPVEIYEPPMNSGEQL